MIRLSMLQALLAFLVPGLMLAAGARADDVPPVFDPRPYAEAKAAAAKEGKWFIAKATAVWCMPCKQMDKTTWREENVVAWLKANAVAVQFDVDKERELSEQLGIQAMPTMIAFKEGGAEFDRVVGYKDAAEFLVWLEGLAKGERSIEAVKRRAAAQPKGGMAEVRARHDLARSLMQSREYDKATEELAWVWENSLGVAGYGGVRGSFLAGEMERLASIHPAAKEKFSALRDAKTDAIAGEKVDPQDVSDWVVLNRVVGESGRTLEWFDKVKAQPRMRPLVNRVALDLEPLLIEHKRWADIALIVPDPIAKLVRDHQIQRMFPKAPMPEGMDEATRKMIEEMTTRAYRERVSTLYAGLLAAGREAEADGYAAKARELDADPAMLRTLIETALTAGQARQKQVQWLEELKDDKEAAALLERVRREVGGQERK